MGLGLLGRGVGDAVYLAQCGADLIVTDLKSKEALAPSLEKLKEFTNISYTLGEHKREDFENRDMILVGPAVPLDSPYVLHAVEQGARKVQSAALFAALSKIPIIGVTGTRGKSTVTAMIHHVLRTVTGEMDADLNHTEGVIGQQNSGKGILLGGNVRGVSNLELLEEVQEDSLAVFELDSWQLQGFGWAEISPQIAIFTNFMEDHLDYYQREGTSKEEAMDTYFSDKANIFRFQEDSGVFITTPEVFEQIKHRLPRVTLGDGSVMFTQEVVLVDASSIPEDAHLSMPGEHNRLNAAFAYQALKAVSLSDEEIFDALASFPGVEGRLQYLKEVNGVKVYNDNNATTPRATVAALESLAAAEKKNIILVAGGADKKLDLSALVESIAKHVKALVLIPGNGTDRLTAELTNGNGTVTNYTVENLPQALEQAKQVAKQGDIILFSPAFASFSQWKNEYERGDEFMKIVTDLEV